MTTSFRTLLQKEKRSVFGLANPQSRAKSPQALCQRLVAIVLRSQPRSHGLFVSGKGEASGTRLAPVAGQAVVVKTDMHTRSS